MLKIFNFDLGIIFVRKPFEIPLQGVPLLDFLMEQDRYSELFTG